MSTNHSHEDDRRSDLAVMDASEYKQKRRLRRILDAHDEVEEIATASYGQYAAGNISADGKNIRILKAVQKYIREAHGLILEHVQNSDLEEDERHPYWEGSKESPLGKIPQHDRDDVVYYGLRDVLYADEMVIERWEEGVQTRHGPNKAVEKSSASTVPEHVSLNAYLLLNEFLTVERDIVGINFEDDGLETWTFLEVDDDEDVVDTAELARERMENGDGEGDDE